MLARRSVRAIWATARPTVEAHGVLSLSGSNLQQRCLRTKCQEIANFVNTWRRSERPHIHLGTGLRAFRTPGNRSATVARVENSLARAEELRGGGDLQGAKESLKNSIADEEAQASDCVEITALHNRYGRLLLLEGDTANAMAAFNKAYTICEDQKATRNDNPFWATTLQSIGLGFLAMEDYDRAEVMLRSAAQAIQICYGDNSQPLLKVRTQLCKVFKAQQDVDKSLEMQLVLLDQLKHMSDSEPLLTYDEAVASYNIANLMYQKREFEAANVMVERAIDRLESLDQMSETVQLNLAFNYELQGLIHEESGNYDAAHKSYKTAMEMFLTSMGAAEFSKSLHVANLLRLLGSLEIDRGNLPLALTLLTQGHEMMAAHVSPDPVAFTLLLNRLGGALYLDGQCEAALEVLLSAVAMLDRPEPLTPVLVSIANIYIDQKDAKNVGETLESAVEMCEESANMPKPIIEAVSESLMVAAGSFGPDFEAKADELLGRLERLQKQL